MLTLYPSNKLEHLSFLLATLLDQQPARGLEADIVLVESPGMQHWLSMQLAEQRGIAMNVSYPLPVRFMWDTARGVLGDDAVPKESPFRRETLRWRIYHLFSDPEMLAEPALSRVAGFFAGSQQNGSGQLQCLQLAMSLADLYEQYLLYRPDWLLAWERHEQITAGDVDEVWQAEVWRKLVSETPAHPARLHERMVAALKAPNQRLIDALPKRIILFAINTMAPQFVAFLDALAQLVDVHLFHLNPCVNYWGNAAGRGEQARLLRAEGIEAWLNQSQDNPLLANLGRQGRDLFNQLTELQSYEISAFDLPPPPEQQHGTNLLSQVQQDILESGSGNGDYQWRPDDHSVLINSAHSTLREVQSLHDYLLLQLDQDAQLQPRDMLVMCPAIEQYAPAIEAVFARVGLAIGDDHASPRIPCTIADRSPLDADPLVAAFLSLLSLPDSRFSVTQILEFLSLAPLQRRFGLSEESLTVIEYWLEQANIHWGLDGTHKAAVTDGATDREMFSWQWGLQRLMLGMVSEDHVQLLGNCVTVPDVEGQAGAELGRLMLVIEQLMQHNQQLGQPRSAEDWQHYLYSLRDDCFAPMSDDTDSWESIGKAIADFALQCEQAGFTGLLSLAEVRDVLTRRFATPDAGNHFMTGQVTFCSMLPMRSIPFKVIAILGLNDGEFPRTNPPGSINIMARQASRQGDRSRRQEDRYLFLEAIISARQALYLSYQGRSALNNAERQPSLVLQEIMDYLHQEYNWDASSAVRQLPLHPFSPDVFRGEWPGYAVGWHRLAQAVIEPPASESQMVLSFTRTDAYARSLSSIELGRCFDDPLAWLARQLGLQLEINNRLLDDSEPFESNKLTRYRYIDELVSYGTHPDSTDALSQRFLLSGDLPDTPVSRAELQLWQEAGQLLLDGVPMSADVQLTVATQIDNVHVYGNCYQLDDELVTYHVGQHQVRRSFVAWITMLIANSEGLTLPLTLHYIDWKKQPLQRRTVRFEAFSQNEAKAMLEALIHMLMRIEQQPVVMHLSVADVFANFAGMTADNDDWLEHEELPKRWEKLTDPNDAYSKLGNNAYFNWFFSEVPEVSDLPLTEMAALYGPFFNSMAKAK